MCWFTRCAAGHFLGGTTSILCFQLLSLSERHNRRVRTLSAAMQMCWWLLATVRMETYERLCSATDPPVKDARMQGGRTSLWILPRTQRSCERTACPFEEWALSFFGQTVMLGLEATAGWAWRRFWADKCISQLQKLLLFIDVTPHMLMTCRYDG